MSAADRGGPGLSLPGAHALVTGGGQGIGLAIARALTAAGAVVTVLGRGEGALAQAVEDGAAAGYEVADVTDGPASAGGARPRRGRARSLGDPRQQRGCGGDRAHRAPGSAICGTGASRST